MSMTRAPLVLSLLSLMAATGCSERSAPVHEPFVGQSDVARGRASGDAAPGAPATATSTPVPATTLDAMIAGQRLIRSGALVLEVADADVAARAVERVAETHGGYPAGLQAGRDALGRRQASVVIRVAPDRFLDAMSAVRALGTTESDSVSTQDVSREYADLQARLRSKQAAAERMRALMGSKTATLDEVLHAESKLSSVLEQLEQIEGQIRAQDQQVALSTITATLREPDSGRLVAAAEPPRPFLAPAREALRTGRDHLAVLTGAAVYVVVVTGPWLALLGLAGLLAHRLRRRTAGEPAAR